jgi:glycosyltransferase involved in cell wall biosynthesis
MPDVLCSVIPKYHDFTLFVPERDVDSYTERGYENFTSFIFTQLSRKSGLILDIGANLGFYSRLARRANEDAVIKAVGSSSESMHAFKGNTKNDNIEIVGEALNSMDKISGISASEELKTFAKSQHPGASILQRMLTESTSSDQLIGGYTESILIKLKMEGFELEGLKSFGPSLLSSRMAKFVIELNPKAMHGAGFNPQDLISFLQDKKYTMYLLNEEKRDWYKIGKKENWREFLDHQSYGNLLCVPEEKSLAIASILHSSGVGGTERCQVELVRDLVGQGVMIKTYLPGESSSLRELLEQAGSSVEIYSNTIWWTSSSKELIHSREKFVDVYSDSGMIKSMKRSGIELVHTQSSVIPQGGVAAALLGLPHVWYVHEFVNLDHGLQFPVTKSQFGEVLLNLSDSIVCNSKIVANHHFVNKENVRVIYPNPEVRPTPSSRQTSDYFVVGIVGNHNEGKGHRQLIDAVALLLGEGLSIKLRIIGPRSEPNSTKMERQISEYGMENSVEFIHTARNLSEIYSNIDCVVIPSRMEAFGRVPFEASTFGLPVIYSNSGGILEYMSNEETGISFMDGDLEGLKNGILKIASSVELRTQLVANAQKNLAAFINKNNSGLIHYLNLVFTHDEFQKKKKVKSNLHLEREQYIQKSIKDL